TYEGDCILQAGAPFYFLLAVTFAFHIILFVCSCVRIDKYRHWSTLKPAKNTSEFYGSLSDIWFALRVLGVTDMDIQTKIFALQSSRSRARLTSIQRNDSPNN